jgi:hypothetical protein
MNQQQKRGQPKKAPTKTKTFRVCAETLKVVEKQYPNKLGGKLNPESLNQKINEYLKELASHG